MIKAEWGKDYDWRSDKCYDAPMHNECGAPILFYEDEYICIGCGEEAELTADMKKWIDDRSGEKTETEVCGSCEQETLKIHYHKNRNTKEWEVGSGKCTNCGMRFIV